MESTGSNNVVRPTLEEARALANILRGDSLSKEIASRMMAENTGSVTGRYIISGGMMTVTIDNKKYFMTGLNNSDLVDNIKYVISQTLINTAQNIKVKKSRLNESHGYVGARGVRVYSSKSGNITISWE